MYIYTGSHLTAVTDDDNDDDDNARHNSAITRETYRQQAASLMEQDNRLAHSRNCCWRRMLFGYLATSGEKSDVIFLLGDPNFL